MNKPSEQIRTEFMQFFTDRGHTFVPSSSLLPADDPTLLFANAGMNQFKDVFLGMGTRPYSRAVNSQKCIRAGGKHNDLEDVGHDTFHQTFFEMLGNWSFGDYFKAEAIEWAWQLLTKVWGLPKDNLWASVFGGEEAAGLGADEEARALWPKLTDLPAERVVLGSREDNFWEPAETGPCGPCTEIHIDLGDACCDASRHPGAKCGVNVDGCGRFIELWNLVFIQFNRNDEGVLEPLPAKHVDTGLGFERICARLQGVSSNYDTDVFTPLLAWIESHSGLKYGSAGETDVAFRAVADHARACSFAIADGILPSNEGRGYVIRRILRRAARFGRALGQHEPFLHRMVPVIVEQMGGFFPELAQRQSVIAETIRQEEESFNRTLDRGLDLFARAAAKADKQISGEVAFELYATYGFPTDLTRQMALERGLTVDMAGYEEEMARHREISSAGAGAFQAEAIVGLPETDDSAKYLSEPVDANVLGWVVGGEFVADGELAEGAEAAVVLDRTSFYGEAGGQVGDTGRLAAGETVFAVTDAKLAGHCVLHVGVMESGSLKVGSTVTAQVGAERMDTRRNHTATHLLNWALRNVLGKHVDQAGSVVEPARLRFDFTHSQAVSSAELAEVERLVNERSLADEVVYSSSLPLAEAQKIPGIRAVFGEKYPDPVRIISIGVADPLAEGIENTPVELCGGTHLERTSQAGLFKIVSEESVAKGVRRITAVTGREAVRYVGQLDESARAAATALRVPVEQIAERVSAMQAEIKKLRKRPAGGGGGVTSQTKVETSAGEVLIAQSDTADAAAMRKLCDVQRQKGTPAMLIGGADGKKVVLIAMVAEETVQSTGLKAGDWVKAAAAVVGGSGGGKPTMAQAGGKDPDKLPQALQAARQWVLDKLG